MPYDPYQGKYVEQTAFPQQRTHHRDVQRLNTTPPQSNRQQMAAAQRQAELEARQRNFRTNTNAPPNTLTQGRRSPRQDVNEHDFDDLWPPRPNTSAVRYSPEEIYEQGNTRVHVQYVEIPPRRSAQTRLPPAPQQQRDTDTENEEEQRSLRLPRSKQKTRWHPVLWFGFGLIAMFVLYIALSNLVYWWQIQRDDWAFQRPRTFQIDAVVGHNDSPGNPSHFIVINLYRHVEIIEIPGGDTSKMKVYDGPVLFGQGEDLTPVTLSFKDVNGDGKPDMLIHVRDQPQEQIFVMINENGAFRAQKPGEQIHF